MSGSAQVAMTAVGGRIEFQRHRGHCAGAGSATQLPTTDPCPSCFRAR
jgi:hypothetical protein